MILKLLDAIGGVLEEIFDGAWRRAREHGAAETFARVIEQYARRHRAEKRDGHWVVLVDRVVIAVSVVTSGQRGQTWFAEVQAEVAVRLGAEMVIRHVWKGEQLPGAARPARQSRSFPRLVEAWNAITRRGTRVAIVSDGRRVIGWIDEPLAVDDIERVARAVAAIARWDAGFASFLEKLPDATPADDDDLSPAVRLAPDGVRVGLRAGAETVIQAPGEAETVWPEVVRDRARILGAIEELRRRRAGASSPYR